MKNVIETSVETSAIETPILNGNSSAPTAPKLPKTPRIPRNRKPVTPRIQLDDETLLEDVTRAAHDAVRSESTLADAVRDCCSADIDRDDVIEAVIAGGYTAERARKTVCEVYCAAGKRVRKAGEVKTGRKPLPASLKLADTLATENSDLKACIKIARGALNELIRREKALASN